MKLMQLIGISAAAMLSFSLVLLAPGTSAADRQVDSGEILLLSDEILGNSVEIERPTGTVPPTNGVPGALVPDGPAPTIADGDPGDGVEEADDGSTLASGADHNRPDKAPGENSRSGLSDGTNPGLGSGRDNSPNQGTDNPSNAPARLHPRHR